jgi:hypothetical protein
MCVIMHACHCLTKSIAETDFFSTDGSGTTKTQNKTVTCPRGLYLEASIQSITTFTTTTVLPITGVIGSDGQPGNTGSTVGIKEQQSIAKIDI